jgi:hypothetical protein
METGGAPPRVTFDDDVQEDLAEEAAAAGDSSGVAKPKRMDTSVSGTDLPKSVRMTVGYSFIIVALVVIIVVQDKSNTNIVGNVVSYLRGGSDWIVRASHARCARSRRAALTLLRGRCAHAGTLSRGHHAEPHRRGALHQHV